MQNATTSTTLHTLTAEEYFGEFSKEQTLLEMKPGSEEIWHWPYNISEGSLYLAKLRPGVVLGISDHHAEVPIRIDFSSSQNIFDFAFILNGDSNIAMMDMSSKRHAISCCQSEAYISYFPKSTGSYTFPASLYRMIVIGVEPWFLRQIVKPATPLASIVECVIRNSCTPATYFSSPIALTPFIKLRLHEMLATPFGGRRKRCFLESKALELLLLITEQFDNRTVSPQVIPLLPQRDDFLRKTRDILLDSISEPPSLEELASRVGVNKVKLNNSFRKTYGTTIFEYLRICRLEKAKYLLSSGQKSIAEIALEVGYSDQSAFSKQFKKYFGVSPRHYKN